MTTSKLKEIKVLNIAQPNAHNVIFNGKNVENRSMPTSFRGTIAIYASKTYSKERFENQSKHSMIKDDCSFGCIIGLVDVVDCITEEEVKSATKEWFNGPYGYVFENVVVLKNPIEVAPPQGAVTWWPLSGNLLDKCIDQIDITKIVPITIAEPKSDIKKPKNAANSKLTPTDKLAEIIGLKPLSYKQAVHKTISYLEENDLIEEEKGVSFIRANEKLKKSTGKSKLSLEEMVEFIKLNLID